MAKRGSNMVSSSGCSNDGTYKRLLQDSSGGYAQEHAKKKVRIGMRTDYTYAPYHDGFQWRKYGQKTIRGNAFPRCYYRCTYHQDHGCLEACGAAQLRGPASVPRNLHERAHMQWCRCLGLHGFVYAYPADRRRISAKARDGKATTAPACSLRRWLRYGDNRRERCHRLLPAHCHKRLRRHCQI